MEAACSALRRRPKHLVRSLLSLLTLSVLVLLTLRHSEVMGPFRRLPPSRGPGPIYRYNVSCPKIYDMDPVEVGKSLEIRRKYVVEDREETLLKLLEDCPTFLRSRGYDDVCVSEEEELFPLAYSMVVHKMPWMVERVLRAVYTPSNVYCIHYDQKSSARFAAVMEGLARCLPNVFIASKREYVDYASISRLKADLNCLSDLLTSEVRWKYVLNLCGQDFPLKSNVELVAELKKLNGANMLETCRPSNYKKRRFHYHYKLQHSKYEYGKLPKRTELKKEPAPHGIQVFVGNAYFVLSREFIKFMDLSVVVADFLAWSEDTYSPDEHFWATLVRLPGAPGEVPRSQADVTDLMSRTRLVKWEYLEGRLYPACTGKHVRSVCIYGAAEMHWLLNDGHWFANKFDPAVDPVLIQCLEEKLEEKQKAFLAAGNCHRRLQATTTSSWSSVYRTLSRQTMDKP